MSRQIITLRGPLAALLLSGRRCVLVAEVRESKQVRAPWLRRWHLAAGFALALAVLANVLAGG